MNLRLAILAAVAALAVAGTAEAAQRIFSYVPADADTRKRVDRGLTFVFDKGVFGMRVKEVLATEARARAGLTPVNERELGARLTDVMPQGAVQRDVYLIAEEDQGPAMVRAFCPGSTKGWMVFEALRPRRDTTVQVLGNDPATGKPRHCATLNFTFRGEWAIPVRGVRAGLPAQDPMRSRF